MYLDFHKTMKFCKNILFYMTVDIIKMLHIYELKVSICQRSESNILVSKVMSVLFYLALLKRSRSAVETFLTSYDTFYCFNNFHYFVYEINTETKQRSKYKFPFLLVMDTYCFYCRVLLYEICRLSLRPFYVR